MELFARIVMWLLAISGFIAGSIVTIVLMFLVVCGLTMLFLRMAYGKGSNAEG